jgi:hypothetical protein
MAALELTSAGRRGLEPYDTWQHRSPPQSRGEVQSHRTRGSAGAHLSQEARSGAAGHVTASELTSAGRQGPKPQETWQHRSLPQSGGEVRSRRTRGRAWMHALLLVLTLSLYVGVPGLQGTDSGPRAYLGRGCEPTGGVNSSTPRSIILNILHGS